MGRPSASAAAAPASWRERWIRWRNARLSDSQFQRWAADFPLTAPIARQRAGALFDVVAGFVYAQMLDACLRLDLFERLRAAPLTASELSAEVGLGDDRLARLLAAAATLELVERLPAAGDAPERWALGAQGAALLGSSGLAQMIAHHRLFYGDMADPVALLKAGRGRLADYWPYAVSDQPAGSSDEAVSAYSALMAATAPAVAADALAAVDLSSRRRLMDVGGGEGVFLAAAGARHPRLELVLADLPAVVARAKPRLAAQGLCARTTLAGVDMLSQPLPAGADTLSLVRVLHDHDDAGVRAILARAHAALPKGGLLIVAEPMSAAPRRDRVADAYFGFYLLAMGRGRARTPGEIEVFLREAGFSAVRQRRTRTPALLRVLTAQA